MFTTKTTYIRSIDISLYLDDSFEHLTCKESDINSIRSHYR